MGAFYKPLPQRGARSGAAGAFCAPRGSSCLQLALALTVLLSPAITNSRNCFHLRLRTLLQGGLPRSQTVVRGSERLCSTAAYLSKNRYGKSMSNVKFRDRRQ